MERKRKALTLEIKYEILNEVEKGLKNKTEIAKMFEIPKSTLSGILSKKEHIKLEYQTSTLSPKRKRHRSGAHEDVDKALFEWFKDARGSNVPISGLILQTKADDLAKKLGHGDVSTSGAWVDRFKQRHNIVSRAISGESGIVDRDVTTEWKEQKLPALLNDYTPNNIFNADETGLFYKLQSKYSLNIRGETCTGGKKSKERLTFLVACNMDGSEKLKLVVIGKFQNPRCFKGVKSLPLTYHANRRAWMTSELFTQWVTKLDRRFHSEKRKVLLFVDNCAAHPKLSGLKAITLAFFPPNTTSVLQPCDQGIIYNLKCKYQQLMAQHIIDSYDKKKDPAINILKAIRYAFSAWQKVSPLLIQKCFRKSGFIMLVDEESMGDDDDIPLAQLIADMQDEIPLARLCTTIQRDISLKDLIENDQDLPVTEERTDDDIVSFISGQEENEYDSGEDDDVSSDETPLVSKVDAMDAVVKLRSYFEANSNTDDSVFRNLLNIESNIIHSQQSQTSILDYFKKS